MPTLNSFYLSELSSYLSGQIPNLPVAGIGRQKKKLEKQYQQ